jgi:polysaccharide export outer membrane protein
MKSKSVLFLCLILLLTSCKVPQNVTYLQGIDKLTPEQMKAMAQEYITTICEDDMLTIMVTAWNPETVSPFNPPAFSYATQGETEITASQQMQTYLVDKDGYINFPIIGRVKAAGLTRQELSDNLQKEISHYVKDPIVNIQIVNFKIILMGEVIRAGKYNVPNDRISIIDAIGNAGDLTINANRTNVLILRHNKGVPEYGRVDLTNPDIFTSPYYYLKQNDIVYVEPNDAKKRNANHSAARQYNVTVFSTILSTVSVLTSTAVSVVALTKNKDNK